MQLRNQTCASAPPLTRIAALQALQPHREQRLNRASRGLSSQFIVGASRRLKSQKLEGASRRLNSQSVAVATAESRASGWLPAEPVGVVLALTGRLASWCFKAVSSGKLAPRLPPGAPPALPNPSLKASPDSVAHWPSSAGPAAHFALAVQRATLSGPPYSNERSK